MTRNRLLILIAIVVLAGGYFFYTRTNGSQSPQTKSNTFTGTQPTTALSPAPTDGMSPKQQELFDKYKLGTIKLPAGFRISVFAEVPTARSLAVSPSGVVYVGNRSNSSVYAVVDDNRDGVADHMHEVAKGMHVPNGVAFKDGDLYIMTISTLYKVAGVERDLTNPSQPEVVYDKFPADEAHGWKYMAFGPDGALYIPVGVPCNSCENSNELFGTVARFDLNTKQVSIVARGVRNSVGFDWKPGTGELWFTDNGRDLMGDDLPGDELNRVTQVGQSFGAPFCYADGVQDSDLPKRNCADFTAPVAVLAPHTAALGMKFYTGSMFPEQYKNQIFIAEHGSWNRSTPIGYRVMMVRLDGDRAVSYEPFIDGWLDQNGQSNGRPVDIAVLADGSMLVSDDKAGAIYRISYSQ